MLIVIHYIKEMIHSESHWDGIKVRPKQLGLTFKKKRESSRNYLLICETQNWDGVIGLMRNYHFLD